MASRRLGQVGLGGDVSVRLDVRKLGIVQLTNRVTGAFRGGAYQGALAVVNERAAIAIQAGMVEQLEGAVRETGRPQRGGERLEKSIMDDRNRDVTASSFIVGRPSWLDRSPAALYWRRIEEGDATTFSAYVLFTDTFTRGDYHRPGEGVQIRMPQHRGVFVQDIGPFPKYEFSRGGQRVLRAFPFKREYTQALKDVGLTLI